MRQRESVCGNGGEASAAKKYCMRAMKEASENTIFAENRSGRKIEKTVIGESEANNRK